MKNKAPRAANAVVAEYKQILKTVLDNRPSGTRQRLAEALNKNRSFVSQIANPAYLTPIPAQHVAVVFEVCHFTQKERQDFITAFGRAHPHRVAMVARKPATRLVSLAVPDFGDAHKNQEFDEMIAQFIKRIAHFTHDITE
jgi:hypothetical protein